MKSLMLISLTITNIKATKGKLLTLMTNLKSRINLRKPNPISISNKIKKFSQNVIIPVLKDKNKSLKIWTR